MKPIITSDSISKRTRYVACLILIAIVFLIWSNGASGGFVWIDHVEIEQAGYRVTNWYDFQQAWTVSLDQYSERKSGSVVAEGGYFRPIYALLISLDWLVWGASPFAFHLTGIAVHAACVAGLFLLGLQLLRDLKHRVPVSFSAAMLFAVHPFGVHSVTWISGRKDTLCAFFAVIALLGLGWLMRFDENRARIKTFLVLVGSVLALNIGLLCKELAIVTPAFATMWIWFDSKSSQPTRESRILVVSFWLSSIGALVYRKLLLGGIGLNTDYPVDSWLGNTTTSMNLVTYYVFRVLFPIQPTIVDRWAISEGLGVLDIFAVVFCVGVLIALCYTIVKRNVYGLFLCWFAIWLLPATGVVPLRHMYAERYLYPASWGLLLFVVFAISKWVDSRSLDARVFYGIVGSVALLFSGITFAANSHWQTDKKLFEHAVAQDPSYAEGLSALALISLDEKEYESAVDYASRAIESSKTEGYRSYLSTFGVHTNAGLAAYHLRRLDEARGYFQSAAEFRPSNPNSYYHLGLVASAANDLSRAEFYYNKALEIQPEHHFSRVNLGHLFLVSQRFDQCVATLKPALEVKPEDGLAQGNIATAYLLTKDFINAEKHFEVVAKLTPQDGLSLAKLAWSEFEIGQLDEAKQHLKSAQQLLPGHPTILHVQRTYLAR